MSLSIISVELCQVCVKLHLIISTGRDLFIVFTTPPLILEILDLLEFWENPSPFKWIKINVGINELHKHRVNNVCNSCDCVIYLQSNKQINKAFNSNLTHS